jgi:hypothetical protein
LQESNFTSNEAKYSLRAAQGARIFADNKMRIAGDSESVRFTTPLPLKHAAEFLSATDADFATLRMVRATQLLSV